MGERLLISGFFGGFFPHRRFPVLRSADEDDGDDFVVVQVPSTGDEIEKKGFGDDSTLGAFGVLRAFENCCVCYDGASQIVH